MNLTEFLEKLRQTRDGWVENGSTLRKRGRGREHCPVTAVCMRMKRGAYSDGDYQKAGERLGLRKQLTTRIVDAADTRTWEPRLRSRLLKAVGLK